MPWKLAIGSTAPTEISHPSWQQILDTLHSLDGGKTCDLLSITLTGKGTLTVGGGDNGRYLVVYFPENHPDTPSLTLTDPQLTGHPVCLTIQTPDDHEARYAVMFPLVEQAFKYFFQIGDIPERLHWEPDNLGQDTA